MPHQSELTMAKSTTGRYTAGDTRYYKISADVKLLVRTTAERNAADGDETHPGPNTQHHKWLLAETSDLRTLSQQNNTKYHRSSDKLVTPGSMETLLNRKIDGLVVEVQRS